MGGDGGMERGREGGEVRGKTGCKEAERRESRERDEKCVARKKKNIIKNRLRGESENKLLENKSSV